MQNQETLTAPKSTGGFARQNMNTQPDSTTIPNLEAVKAKQKATWESGDFGQIARTIENVAEEFMARQSIPAGAQVLDVACGTGNQIGRAHV